MTQVPSQAQHARPLPRRGLERLDLLLLSLEAYPPRYNENDPPYELPPAVVALQPELFTLLMDTLTPLAVVDPDVLLLLPLLL